jgi:hypothetical protein
MRNLVRISLENQLEVQNLRYFEHLVPNLKMLSVKKNSLATQTNSWRDLNFNLIGLLYHCYANLDSLIIKDLSNPMNLFKLGENCPNLRNLKLFIPSKFKKYVSSNFVDNYSEEEDDDNATNSEQILFENIFALAKVLHLKHLSIVIGISYDIKDLILGLENHFLELFFGEIYNFLIKIKF